MSDGDLYDELIRPRRTVEELARIAREQRVMVSIIISPNDDEDDAEATVEPLEVGGMKAADDPDAEMVYAHGSSEGDEVSEIAASELEAAASEAPMSELRPAPVKDWLETEQGTWDRLKSWWQFHKNPTRGRERTTGDSHE